jgi:transmembrane sensor
MAGRTNEQITEQAQHWVVRLASGETTAEELAAFRAWRGRSAVHARAFADERTFWHRLAALEDTFDRLAPGAENPDARSVSASSRRGRRNSGGTGAGRRPATRRVRRVAAIGLAAAACLLLILVAPQIATTLQADYVSGTAGTVAIVLPDGSRATLNRNSAIRVDYGDRFRRVELLEGEVFVEVRPNPARPFRVIAGRGVSEAVGTAYVVRRSDRGTRVTVAKGVVAVEGRDDPPHSVTLRAGEGVRYADGRLRGGAFPVDTANALAWRSGKVVFVDRPLSDALAELERYHRGRILLLGGRRTYKPISGVIDLDKLDEGIAALAATHGLTMLQLTPYLTVLR